MDDGSGQEGRTPSLTDRFYLPDYSMLFAIKELAGFQRGATSPLGAVGTPTRCGDYSGINQYLLLVSIYRRYRIAAKAASGMTGEEVYFVS